MPAPQNDFDGQGEWGQLVDWPLIGIHAILTLDHELLTFGTDARGMQSAETIYDIWNYSTDTHYTLPNTTGTDIFCSVPALIPETGEILISGGDARPFGNTNKGVDDVNIYTPEDRSLRPAPEDMDFARWYATAVTLANGDIVILGGINGAGAGVRVPELYSAETGWRQLPGAGTDATSAGNNWWFPRAWPTSDGKIVILADAQNQLFMMDPTGGGSVEFYGNLGFDPTFRHPALMVGEDQFLFAAGNDRAYLVDVSGGQPVVSDAGYTGDRVWGEMTILANGDVLITGGSAVDNGGNENKTAMIWDRESNTITSTGEAEDNARLYHSTAVLMPDGSVLSLGGGAPGPYTHTNGQSYYPEYLYDQDGQLADRISILDAPREIEQQEDFVIRVDDPGSVARVTMVKHGSVTHSLNMETRFHEPDFTVNGDGTITINPTDNAHVLTPGAWMVFVLDENDVPSEAISVMVATDETAYGGGQGSGIFEDAGLNGSAFFATDEVIELTPDANNQVGAVTSGARIDFSKAFDLSLEMYLGDSEAGADGIAITFHNDPAGKSAMGGFGIGLGASGIQNGVAVKFDTWRNPGEIAGDHTNIFNTETGASLTPSSALGQLEDGDYHLVKMSWDPENQRLTYTIDDVSQPDLTADLAAQYFGSDLAWMTISAGTGGASNNHIIRNVTFNGVTEDGDIGVPPAPGDTVPVREWPNGFELTGSARLLDDGSSFELTPDQNNQLGAVATNDRVSFEQNFMITLDIYLGENDAGADGVSMAFHNDLRGADAIGELGIGLGLSGIQNGLGIEFDTWQNAGEPAQDHTNFLDTESFTTVTAPNPLGQLENGAFHAVSIMWNAGTQTLMYQIDGQAAGSLTGDLVQTYLGGEAGAYFVVTGTTGGASNQHLVRDIRLMQGDVYDGTPDPQPDPEPEPDPDPEPQPDPDTVFGNPWGEWLKGGGQDDRLDGLGGDDVVRGYAGNDTLLGGAGADTLRGEAGDDVLTGGTGPDLFVLRAGKWGEGDDIATDFLRGVDRIDFGLSDALNREPGLAGLSGDPDTIELGDLQASGNWSLGASADGDVLLSHSTGSIEFDGVAFGQDWDDFRDLGDVLTLDGTAIPGGGAPNPDPEPGPEPDPDPEPDPEPDPPGQEITLGNAWGEWLKGTNGDDALNGVGGDDVVRGYAGNDLLIGGAGDDTLRGEAGDDTLTGGIGEDVFRIRAGKWNQGQDVITDFEIGTDKLVFVGADMLNRDPGLPGNAGDPAALGLDDLDADGAFSLSASADGDLLIGHQTGSVELDGIAYDANTDRFVELANILEIDVA